jgi:hypothetical protein
MRAVADISLPRPFGDFDKNPNTLKLFYGNYPILTANRKLFFISDAKSIDNKNNHNRICL